MAVIYEEFIRCEKCDNPDFKQEEILTFHKKIKPRTNKQTKLEVLDNEIRYICTKCGHELDR